MAEDNELEELRAEIDKLSAKNKELITELRKARGTTNEEAARLAAELDDVKAEKVKLEAALKKANDGFTATNKELSDKLQAKSQAMQRLIRDEGLVKSLASVNIRKEFLGPVAAYLKDRVEVDEEKGEAFVTIDGAKKPLSEFVTSWATSDEGKNFVVAQSSISGDSAGPGGAKATAGLKSMTRAQFDALGPTEKFEFSKNGGTLTE